MGYGEDHNNHPIIDEELSRFRTGVMSLNQSRFVSRTVVRPFMDSRHERWDSDDEEEEYDYYRQDEEDEESPEEKRRRLERMEERNIEERQRLRGEMEDVWEKMFYGDDRMSREQNIIAPKEKSEASGTIQENEETSHPNDNAASSIKEREIHWYQYHVTPPQSNDYRVPLPFDSTTDTTSHNFGYAHLENSWREHQMSESIRKLLERCDSIRGFNLFIDGGRMSHVSSLSSKSNFAAGGMYAGLATSIMEELHDECKSAGRWAVLVDSLFDDSNLESGAGKMNELIQVQQFQRQLNTGLALHGLSLNADIFLPLSIDGGHRALYGDRAVSPNRLLFEGSAALALALEASTLSYRLRSNLQSTSGCHRARLGIQSGFYQGSASNDVNEAFASASSLTYHEYLACMRSSSDKRRSILELDVMMHPLSFPESNVLGQGADLSSNILASLMATGVIGGNAGASQSLGMLHQRFMRGTSLEQMQIEQNRNYRSRNYSSTRQSGPGEWLEDRRGGGLLESLSGHSDFGRRSDHHHFALSSALRPSSTDVTKFSTRDCGTSAFLRPMMEGMGVKYRPEVSSCVVVKDTVMNLTEVGSYWNSIIRRTKLPTSTDGKRNASPQAIAEHTPILSTLGNSTRSYPRLRSISSGFVDSLSRKNMGYLSRDVVNGDVPERDDCEDALEYCRELLDVYEPPTGSGLLNGDDENDLDSTYFDE